METQKKSVISYAAKPVTWLSAKLGQVIPHDEKISRAAIGVSIMLGAAYANGLYPVLIPKFIWDAATWCLHGLGAAPILDELETHAHNNKNNL